MYPKKSLTAVAAALVLTTAACSSDGDDATTGEEGGVTATTIDELYAAAQEEGTIQIYGPTEDLYSDVYADFSEEYPGIEIVTADIFGQELDARLEGELVAGGFEADLVHIGVSDVERYMAMDYLEPYEVIGMEGVADNFIGTDNLWSVPSQHLYAPVFSASMAESEIPTTWDEVVDGRLVSQVALSNPAVSGVVPQTFSAALAEGVIDEAWLETLRDTTQPRIYPSVSNALQAVVSGETQMSLVAGYGTYMRQLAQGAPLVMHPLDDGAYMSDVAYATLADSPNPNAARLLVSWMFSEAGQASIAEHVYEFGTVDGAPLPEGAEELGDFVELVYPGAEHYRSTLELLNTLSF